MILPSVVVFVTCCLFRSSTFTRVSGRIVPESMIRHSSIASRRIVSRMHQRLPALLASSRPSSLTPSGRMNSPHSCAQLSSNSPSVSFHLRLSALLLRILPLSLIPCSASLSIGIRACIYPFLTRGLYSSSTVIPQPDRLVVVVYLFRSLP